MCPFYWEAFYIYRSILVKGSGKRLFTVHIGLYGERLNIGCFLQIPDNELIFQFRFSHKRFEYRFLSMYEVAVAVFKTLKRRTQGTNFDSFNSKQSFFSIFIV